MIFKNFYGEMERYLELKTLGQQLAGLVRQWCLLVWTKYNEHLARVQTRYVIAENQEWRINDIAASD